MSDPAKRTMKAIVRDRYGSPDVLRLSEAEMPDVGDEQVRVRVRAAGLDRGAWHVMAGLPYPPSPHSRPCRPKLDLVRSLGADRVIHRQLGAMVLSLVVRQRLGTFIAKPNRTDLDALGALIEAGSVTPAVDRVIALDQVPDAIRDLTDGRVRGKIVVADAPTSG
jgi:NADPH:quinone reductase-like Zn-dependent oxidoreductase